MEPKQAEPLSVLIPAPFDVSPRSRRLMALTTKGPAYFSTNMQQHPPRDATENMPVAVRSDPEADREMMMNYYRKKYPLECRLLTPDAEVKDYFDGWDIKYNNFGFLYTVLQEMARANAALSSSIGAQVQVVARDWRATNEEAFQKLSLSHCLEDVFTVSDIKEYGLDIMVDVWKELQQQKVNEDHYKNYPLQSQTQIAPAQDKTADPQALETASIAHKFSKPVSPLVVPGVPYAVQGAQASRQLPTPQNEYQNQYVSSHHSGEAPAGQRRGQYHGQLRQLQNHQSEAQRIGDVSQGSILRQISWSSSQGPPNWTGPSADENVHRPGVHIPWTNEQTPFPGRSRESAPGPSADENAHRPRPYNPGFHTAWTDEPFSGRCRESTSGVLQGVRNPKKRTSDDARIPNSAGSVRSRGPDPNLTRWYPNPYSMLGPQHTSLQNVTQEMSSESGQNWSQDDTFRDSQPILAHQDVPRASGHSQNAIHLGKNQDGQRFVSNPYAGDTTGLQSGAEMASSTLTRSPQRDKQHTGEVHNQGTKENLGLPLPQSKMSPQNKVSSSAHTEIPHSSPPPMPATRDLYFQQPPIYFQRQQINQSEDYDYNTLWVGNVPVDMTKAQEKNIFGHWSTIAEISPVKSFQYESQAGYVFLRFPNRGLASEAFASLQDRTVPGMPNQGHLDVKFRQYRRYDAQSTKYKSPSKTKGQKRADPQVNRVGSREVSNKYRTAATHSQAELQNNANKSDNKFAPLLHTSEGGQDRNLDTMSNAGPIKPSLHEKAAYQVSNEAVNPLATQKSIDIPDQPKQPRDSEQQKDRHVQGPSASLQTDGSSAPIATSPVKRQHHRKKSSGSTKNKHVPSNKEISGNSTPPLDHQKLNEVDAADTSVSTVSPVKLESSQARNNPTEPQLLLKGKRNKTISHDQIIENAAVSYTQESRAQDKNNAGQNIKSHPRSSETLSSTYQISCENIQDGSMSQALDRLPSSSANVTASTTPSKALSSRSGPHGVSGASPRLDPDSLRSRLEASMTLLKATKDDASLVSMHATPSNQKALSRPCSPERTDRPEIPTRTSSLLQSRTASPVKYREEKQQDSAKVPISDAIVFSDVVGQVSPDANEREKANSSKIISTTDNHVAVSHGRFSSSMEINRDQRPIDPNLIQDSAPTLISDHTASNFDSNPQTMEKLTPTNLSPSKMRLPMKNSADSGTRHKHIINPSLPMEKSAERTANLVEPCEAQAQAQQSDPETKPCTEMTQDGQPHQSQARDEAVSGLIELYHAPRVNSSRRDLTLPSDPMSKDSANIAIDESPLKKLDDKLANITPTQGVSLDDGEYHISEVEKQQIMNDHFADMAWREKMLRDMAAFNRKDYSKQELQAIRIQKQSEGLAKFQQWWGIKSQASQPLESKLDIIISCLKLQCLSYPKTGKASKAVLDALKKADILLKLCPRRNKSTKPVMSAEDWDKKATEFLVARSWDPEQNAAVQELTQNDKEIFSIMRDAAMEKGKDESQDDEFPLLPNPSTTDTGNNNAARSLMGPPPQIKLPQGEPTKPSEGAVSPHLRGGFSPTKGQKKRSNNTMDTAKTFNYAAASKTVGGKPSAQKSGRQNGDPWALPNEELAWGADGKKRGRKASKSFGSG